MTAQDRRGRGSWDWLLVLVAGDGATDLRRVTGIRKPQDALVACWPEAVPGAAVTVLDRSGMVRRRYTPSHLEVHAGKWTRGREQPGWQADPPTLFGSTNEETT